MDAQRIVERIVMEPGRATGVEVPEEMARQVAPRAGAGSAVKGPAPQPMARSLPREVPLPVAVETGPRILIYKQDPSVTELGVRMVFVPSVVLAGPSDLRFTTELRGTTPVARNIDNDFIFPPNSKEFDCAHTFAVVRQALTMYERHNAGNPIPFAWNSGGNTDRLSIFPHAAVGANAFYSRTAKALKFLFFTPEGGDVQVFTCRSFDIVAHEAGHAILDGLKPGWLGIDNPPQTGGLHEAFGDLTAIFLALSQPDQAEALVAATKANLHAKSFLSSMAEQFGTALGLPFGLRNADNDLKLSEVSNEVHAVSQVFTGGVYDVLADVYSFEYAQQRKIKDPAVLLMEVANRLCRLLFDSIMAAPPIGATYADVVNKMLQASADRGDPAIYRTFIRNRFAFREVVASPTPLTDLLSGRMEMANATYTGDGKAGDITEVAPADEHSASLRAVQDRSHCCGTMQLPEFGIMDAARLATRGPLEEHDILAAERDELSKSLAKFNRNDKK